MTGLFLHSVVVNDDLSKFDNLKEVLLSTEPPIHILNCQIIKPKAIESDKVAVARIRKWIPHVAILSLFSSLQYCQF